MQIRCERTTHSAVHPALHSRGRPKFTGPRAHSDKHFPTIRSVPRECVAADWLGPGHDAMPTWRLAEAATNDFGPALATNCSRTPSSVLRA